VGGEVLVTGVEARRGTQPADTGARGMNAVAGVIPRVTVTGEHAEAVRDALLVIRTSSERRAVAT